MKPPELGDVIVTRNGMRWICATFETIREKVAVDLNRGYREYASYPICGYPEYASYPIKAYNVDEKSFSVWAGNETGDYAIVEVIPAETVRPEVPQKPRKHSELIKAWADGADIEWYDRGTEKWIPVSGPPSWWKDDKYRIKTTRELVCHINSDGEISSVGSGNLSLTFNLLGELISAEVIKK